jgi:hypothetical protein
VDGKSQIDYIKKMTLIAVVEEFGFDRVVGVAEYLLPMDSHVE